MNEIICTAWDCCGTYYDLVDNTHEIFVGENGRVAYHAVTAARGYNSVKLFRFDSSGPGLRTIVRYVKPEQVVVLKPI